MNIFFSALALGATSPNPVAVYNACVKAAASEAGDLILIDATKTEKIVATCKKDLATAAEWLVDHQGYKTMNPAHMQTRQNLLRAASFDLEYSAKRSISPVMFPSLPAR